LILLLILGFDHKTESVLLVLLKNDMRLPTTASAHSAQVFLDFDVVSELNPLFE
jgi:hypothetical protein